MPIYTFRCSNEKCGAEVDVRMSFKERESHMQWCEVCQEDLDAKPGALDPILNSDSTLVSARVLSAPDSVGLLQRRMFNVVGGGGGQCIKADGAYRMKLIMSDGTRPEVAHHKGRRSDH